MLEQALMTLAAACGAAVVRAAGTDAWTGLRVAVARWLGRGDGQREQAELERLDQTASELQSAETAQAEVLRIRQEAAWQARIEALLERLDHDERAQAAEELRTLLTQHTHQGGVSAGPGGLAVGGSVDMHAGEGSIVAGVIHGGAHIGRPSKPDPSQG
ncbi:cell division protein ZapB [Streptomyces sp. NPDC054813]